MNHDSAALVGSRPGLCVFFVVCVEHAAVLTRLQFKIAIEISKRGKVPDYILTVAALLRLLDDAEDVDDGRGLGPIASANSIQPLGKEPPVAGSERNDHKGQNQREGVPIVD